MTFTIKVDFKDLNDPNNSFLSMNPINVMIPLRGYHNIERWMGDVG